MTMPEPAVKLQHLCVGTGRALFITINGRQALHEGPRRVGHCVYCNGPCAGATRECEPRVYAERKQQPDGRRS